MDMEMVALVIDVAKWAMFLIPAGIVTAGIAKMVLR